jgi:hypothetical protein
VPSQRAIEQGWLGVISWDEAKAQQLKLDLARVGKAMNTEISKYVRDFTTENGRFVGDLQTLGRMGELQSQLNKIAEEAGYPDAIHKFLARRPELPGSTTPSAGSTRRPSARCPGPSSTPSPTPEPEASR